MKKLTIWILFILALSVALCACGKLTSGNEGGGGAADVQTTEGTAATDAQATDGAVATGKQEEPAVLSEEEEFKKLLGEGNYWRALGCIFEKPEDIAAKFYFYNGVGSNEQASDEELAFILNAFKEKNPNSDPNYGYNYMRLPVEKINEALSILNVTVDDIKIPEHWAYYDKTDAYYFWASDAYGVTGWSVTKVEKDDDGIVRVYWETDGFFFTDTSMEKRAKGAKMVYTMQLQSDGTYRVLSNLPQE